MKQIVKKTLLKFGLTDKEILVYEACLGRENLTPTYISKETGIPRSSVYDIALGLSLKGLITLKQSDGIQKQQTLMNAVNPEEMRKIVREKRRATYELENDLIDAIPFLKKEYFNSRKDTSPTSVEFINGYDDFKRIYYNRDRELLGDEVYAWDSFLPVDTHGLGMGNDDVSDLTTHLKKNPQQRFEIIPNNERVRMAVGYHYAREPEYFELIQHRYIDNDLFNLYNRIEIRDNSVYLFSTQEEEVYAIIIKSQNFARSLKSIFLLQWMSANPITKSMYEQWKEHSKVTYYNSNAKG